MSDARTDGRTDGHLRPALLGGLCQRVDLKIKLGIWPFRVKISATMPVPTTSPNVNKFFHCET